MQSGSKHQTQYLNQNIIHQANIEMKQSHQGQKGQSADSGIHLRKLPILENSNNQGNSSQNIRMTNEDDASRNVIGYRAQQIVHQFGGDEMAGHIVPKNQKQNLFNGTVDGVSAVEKTPQNYLMKNRSAQNLHNNPDRLELI